MEILNMLNEKNGDKREVIELFAPGRINLIGEHIDYVGGKVFPAAITLGIKGYASKSDEINIFSNGISEKWTTENVNEEYKMGEFEGFMSYVKGIYNVLNKRLDKKIGGLNIIMESNLPLSSGLSSSAAFGMMIITALNELYDLKISKKDKAIFFKEVENEQLGLKSGIMDQFAISLGKENKFMLLDCATLEYEYVNSELHNKKFIIFNTKKPRNLVESKYNERVEELAKVSEILKPHFEFDNLVDLKEQMDEALEMIKDPILHKRLRHVLTESHRVDDMMIFLTNDDGINIGRTLSQGHNSLRDDYEVSCDELNFIQARIQMASNVYGARMVGAGFGGCVLALIDDSFDKSVIEDIKAQYKNKFGYEFEEYFVLIGDGARKV